MAVKRRRTTARTPKVKARKTAKRASYHAGYHAEHVAMLYRLGGAGIIIVAGTVIVFLVRTVLFTY